LAAGKLTFVAVGTGSTPSMSYGRMIFTRRQLGDEAIFRNPDKSESCSMSEGITACSVT
jgi:hypothetical protein